MKRNSIVGLVACAAMLAGCSSGVQRPAAGGANARTAVTAPVALSAATPARAVSISMSEDAKKKAADNLKFNPDTLLDHVKRALAANDLYRADAPEDSPSLEVVITDMRVRSNFSAVAFGFMAGADSIAGDVIVKDAIGAESDRFKVKVSYALGGIAGGLDQTRMEWMYEKFAEEALRELAKQAPKKG